MAKKADTWMPLYVGEYLADTTNLNTEQHGAYFLMLLAAWKRGGKLPNDDGQLASITKLTPARWKAHRGILLELFRVEGEALAHKRVTAEHQRAQEISEKRAGAGKGGADSRWSSEQPGMSRSERLASARRLATHSELEWSALKDVCGCLCVHCGIAESELHGQTLTKDHIKPIYQGGSDGIENLQPSCRNCNSRKGSDDTDKRPLGWRELLAKRLANASQTPGPLPSHEHPPSEGSKEPIGSSSAGKLPPCPHQKLLTLYAERLPMLPQPKPEMWGGQRAKHLASRWKWLLTATKKSGDRYATNEEEALDWFGRFFTFVAGSDFLTGRSGKFTSCDLGWLANEENFAKVVQGNYENKATT